MLFHVCLSPVVRRQVTGEKHETPSVRTGNESVANGCAKIMTSGETGGQKWVSGIFVTGDASPVLLPPCKSLQGTGPKITLLRPSLLKQAM